MNEELNQVQDLGSDTDEFDWEVDATEDTTEVEDTTEEVADATEEPTSEEPQVEEPFLSIRYNKEDKNLTRDEAITLSQKGMNYDHLNEKYTSLNTRLDKLARANGMDVEQYLAQLSDAQNAYSLKSEVERLREEYPSAEDDVLEALAKKNIGEKESQYEATLKSQQEQKEAEEKANLERQLNIFTSQFPEVDASKLDDKVYDLMDKGYELLSAYLVVEREKQNLLEKTNKEREKSQQANDSNKAKSLGNTTNVSSDDEDAFLSGFYSD